MAQSRKAKVKSSSLRAMRHQQLFLLAAYLLVPTQESIEPSQEYPVLHSPVRVQEQQSQKFAGCAAGCLAKLPESDVCEFEKKKLLAGLLQRFAGSDLRTLAGSGEENKL